VASHVFEPFDRPNEKRPGPDPDPLARAQADSQNVRLASSVFSINVSTAAAERGPVSRYTWTDWNPYSAPHREPSEERCLHGAELAAVVNSLYDFQNKDLEALGLECAAPPATYTNPHND